MSAFLFAVLANQPALAGKLADGWRGHPWGSAESLRVQPGSTCRKPPPGDMKLGFGGLTHVLWLCTERVGADNVFVSYAGYAEGRFDGLFILCKGYEQCLSLKTTLSLAWGMPYNSSSVMLSDSLWNDGKATADFTFDAIENVGMVTVNYDWKKAGEVREK